MTDYIKREDAIKTLEGWKISGEMILATVPPADVVEVVRCKDCKYYVLHTLFGHTQGWCDRSIAYGTEEDDYCSFGERAEE